MSVDVTELFARLCREEACKIKRFEVFSSHFSVFRRKLRLVISRLLEVDDESETAKRLHSELSKWLTMPIEFDHEIIDTIDSLGAPSLIESRWGSEIRGALDDARTAAVLMCQSESPMRSALSEILTDLANRNVQFRIYCDRTARPEFESLLGLLFSRELMENLFLHSPANYREVRQFDVLVKVGPLRSSGWGKTPDAVLTAPRFRELIQLVWSGCNDEQGFGYDPVATAYAAPKGNEPNSPRGENRVKWDKEVFACGDDPAEGKDTDPDEDDFLILSQPSQTEEMCRCVLLEFDHGHGVLYLPHSSVLSVDPTDESATSVDLRLAGEGLSEGMLLITKFLGDAGLEGLQAGEGSYSRIWKSRLKEVYLRNPHDLLRKLRAAGIGLKGLRGSVERWFGPATSVIRAPQKDKHFEILIKVLESEFPSAFPPAEKGGAWWKYAWREIKKSRGEAIQTGRQEQDDIDDCCLEILQQMIPNIREEVGKLEDAFTLIIPEGYELKGAFLFRKIVGIEHGFKAPYNCLREITEMEELEQWRE